MLIHDQSLPQVPVARKKQRQQPEGWLSSSKPNSPKLLTKSKKKKKDEEVLPTCTSRKVSFSDPPTTEVYFKCEVLSPSDDCWYSKSELDGFWGEMVASMRDAFSQEQASSNPFYWTKALVRIYEAFYAPPAAQNSLFMLLQGRFEIPNEAVGLEMPWILAHLGAKAAARHEAVWNKIQYWQEQTEQGMDVQQDAIAQACTEESQVPVRFAHFVATLRAQQVAKELQAEDTRKS